MEWASFAIGFGGLLLGALTAYLSYVSRKDERTHEYRQALYNKQFEGCAVIARLAFEHENDILLFIRRYDTEDEDDFKKIKEKLYTTQHEFIFAAGQWLTFFPQTVNEAINDFGIAGECLLDTKRREQQASSSEIANATKKLDDAFWNLIAAIRITLGIEHLSSESIKLMSWANRPSQAFSESYVQRQSAASPKV